MYFGKSYSPPRKDHRFDRFFCIRKKHTFNHLLYLQIELNYEWMHDDLFFNVFAQVKSRNGQKLKHLWEQGQKCLERNGNKRKKHQRQKEGSQSRSLAQDKMAVKGFFFFFFVTQIVELIEDGADSRPSKKASKVYLKGIWHSVK